MVTSVPITPALLVIHFSVFIIAHKFERELKLSCRITLHLRVVCYQAELYAFLIVIFRSIELGLIELLRVVRDGDSQRNMSLRMSELRQLLCSDIHLFQRSIFSNCTIKAIAVIGGELCGEDCPHDAPKPWDRSLLKALAPLH